MFVLARCRKAQGLPITTVILAILALLVLLVMGLIFGGRIQLFGKDTRAVTEQQCDPAVGEPRFVDECSEPITTVRNYYKGGPLPPGTACCKWETEEYPGTIKLTVKKTPMTLAEEVELIVTVEMERHIVNELPLLFKPQCPNEIPDCVLSQEVFKAERPGKVDIYKTPVVDKKSGSNEVSSELKVPEFSYKFKLVAKTEAVVWLDVNKNGNREEFEPTGRVTIGLPEKKTLFSVVGGKTEKINVVQATEWPFEPGDVVGSDIISQAVLQETGAVSHVLFKTPSEQMPFPPKLPVIVQRQVYGSMTERNYLAGMRFKNGGTKWWRALNDRWYSTDNLKPVYSDANIQKMVANGDGVVEMPVVNVDISSGSRSTRTSPVIV